jgi:hypothetical protein
MLTAIEELRGKVVDDEVIARVEAALQESVADSIVGLREEITTLKEAQKTPELHVPGLVRTLMQESYHIGRLSRELQFGASVLRTERSLYHTDTLFAQAAYAANVLEGLLDEIIAEYPREEGQ